MYKRFLTIDNYNSQAAKYHTRMSYSAKLTPEDAHGGINTVPIRQNSKINLTNALIFTSTVADDASHSSNMKSSLNSVIE